MAGPTGDSNPRVSAVIATLGGESLRDTVASLNAGSVAPGEILVCIPAAEAQRVEALRQPNVRIVVTDCRGQVPQRIFGFRRAGHELVVQLDDDVLLEPRCLERLIRDLDATGPRSAVAPALRWLRSGQSVYKPIGSRALSRFFYWLMNGRSGYRPGTVTRAGAEIGVPPPAQAAGPVEAEWLPGGCVLHRRADLVLDNYFPFAGKAFCEDLIHSFHLRSRGVRLLVSQEAVAYIDEPPPEELSGSRFLRALRGDFRARSYYVELSSRSKLRMYLFFFARIVRRMVR